MMVINNMRLIELMYGLVIGLNFIFGFLLIVFAAKRKPDYLYFVDSSFLDKLCDLDQSKDENEVNVDRTLSFRDGKEEKCGPESIAS